jgi:putative transcriptional regulator
LEKLKNLRIKNGYTHQDMANFLSISKSFYWQIECDKRTLSYRMAVKISRIFHEMPDDIFYDDFKNKD